MTIPSALTLNLALAAGLGLAVGLLLWLLRGFSTVRRLRAGIVLAALSITVFLVVTGAGLASASLGYRIVLAAALMLGANAVLQLFDFVLWDYLIGQRRHIAVPRLLVDLFNFIALAAAALIVLNGVFGVDLSALLVTSTVVSAVIGLALQDMLSSVIAGLALQLEQPFSVGDWVLVSGHEGQVVQMNWRTLTLRTRENQYVIVPNSSAAKQDIVNFTRPSPLVRVQVSVGLAYTYPPGTVEPVLLQAASGAQGVQTEPAPDVIVHRFNDSSIEYRLRFWITDYEHVEPIKSRVQARIWYGLRRAGLTIPYPVREVNLHTISEDHEARAAARRQRQMFEALRPLGLFAALTDAQIEQMVRTAALEHYTHGEVLVRQGEAGDSLFVITVGQVQVQRRDEQGQTATVASLGPGEFFGEMSLLTGEPRSASVLAVEEVEVVVVDKPDLSEVLQADTGLLGALSAALEARLRSRAEQAAQVQAADRRDPAAQTDLLRRIRRFFSIKVADGR